VRLGIVCGGGDCPGTNAVIRAIVRKADSRWGAPVIGFQDAWRGLMEGRFETLDPAAVRGILPRGGTILGTRRGSPFDHPDGVETVRQRLVEAGVDALVVIGGNGSLTVAGMLAELGLPIIGVPKTIDNDVVGTDMTFGFQTAVQIASDAIDRLHTTAESHDRIMVVEVMGRDTGWIALHAGLAGGATVILVPEVPFDPAEVAALVARRHDRGRFASIVVVAEGARPIGGTMSASPLVEDPFGRPKHAEIARAVAADLSERTGYESRVVQLGHLQRGGTPTAYDRVLSTRFGLAAVDAAAERAFGTMVVLRCGRLDRAPLDEARGRIKELDVDLYRDAAAALFG